MGNLTKKVVANHQPNYFPWLGYFNKIYKSDTFVFLDEVQFPRTSSANVVNRSKILCNGEAKWLTCTLEKKGSLVKIGELEIKNGIKSANFEKIKQYYKKSKFYKEVIDFVEEIMLYKESNLSNYNINAIQKICEKLDIKREFILQSSLNTTTAKEDLMIEITKKVGGEIYLSGNGARKYQIEENFLKQGVELVYQEFTPRSYEQNGAKEFIAGLSVLDALFNVGFEATKELIAQ